MLDMALAAQTPPQPVTMPGIGVAQSHLRSIAQGDFKSKGRCREFFAKVIEQNNLDTSVDSLMDQLQATAVEAATNVYDGPSSTTVLDAEKFPGVASSTITTVGQHFAAIPGEIALSQANGAAIWIRQADWFGWFSPFSGSNGPDQYGQGVLFHELLHKQTVGGGFSHDQIRKALLGVQATETSLGRERMSHNLGKLCF
jgi:hypothetical protein